MELSSFLEAYSQVLKALTNIAKKAKVAPGRLLEKLLESPFVLPMLLRNAPGADRLASDLEELANRRREVSAGAGAINDGVRGEVRAAFEELETRGIVRGGGATGMATKPSTGQHAKPPVSQPPAAAPAPGAPQSAPAAAARAERAPSRWISAEIDDHEKDQPLAKGETYLLSIGVDVERRENAVGEAMFEDDIVFGDGSADAELTVELHSDDFDIDAVKPKFRLKSTGKGQTKALFEITPRREGRATLSATIHKAVNFVQQLTITLSVGDANAEPPATTSFSRPSSGVSRLAPRRVMMMMLPATPKGYSLLVVDEQGSKMTTLKVEALELSREISAARDALLSVVQRTDDAGNAVFQSSIDIVAAENGLALTAMARAGSRLFQTIFEHDDNPTDAIAVGNWLRDLKTDAENPLSIQIVSDSAPIPWPLLYVGDASSKATLDWNNFLGLRHIIEQLPKVDQLGQGGAVIASDKPKLEVSINLNRKIDDDWRTDFVAEQETFWAKTAEETTRVNVTSRTEAKQFVDALGDAGTTDQVMYLYCHASTSGIQNDGSAGDSSLALTDASITLADLRREASTSIKLAGNPLVFINACESAELSPLFYDGFVPYFMMKGARGVIGTECRTPGIFAAKWAERFFKRFLNGDPLGRVFFDLRKEFLDAHGNPLGLLYAVYCSSDTQVQPAL